MRIFDELLSPRPRVTPGTKNFWDGLKRHVFSTTKCKKCGETFFPPKFICPECLSYEIDWVKLTGRGKLYAFTRLHVAPTPFVQEAPYVLGIVDLDEGLRLATRIRGRFEDLRIGMDLTIVFLNLDEEITIFNFEPAI